MVGYTIQKDILMERSFLFDLLDSYPITLEIKYKKNKYIKNKELIVVSIYYMLDHKLSSDLDNLIVSGNELSPQIRLMINNSNNIKMKWFLEWIDKRKSKNHSIPSNIMDIYNIMFNIDDSFKFNK